jgi:hypothetical protein
VLPTQCLIGAPWTQPSLRHPAERHLSRLVAATAGPARAATTDLRSLVHFSAPALPGERDEAGITELIDELNRRGETTARGCWSFWSQRGAALGRGAVLWLLRVGLAVAVSGLDRFRNARNGLPAQRNQSGNMKEL